MPFRRGLRTDWQKENCLILSIKRKDLVDIVKGDRRQAGQEDTTPAKYPTHALD